MGLVSDNSKQLVKDRVDIVRYAEDNGLKLMRDGANYKALCPFHDEKTASFIIFPEKQSFRCFGCSVSGDVITLAMKLRHLEFMDALKELADIAGVQLEDYTAEERAHAAAVNVVKEKIYWVNQKAADFYAGILFTETGAAALEYLYSRGFTEETLKAFNIGFAPKTASLQQHIKTVLENAGKDSGYNNALKALKDGGLVGESERGWEYERFRGRIIFPVCDRNGLCVGFSARQLVEDKNYGKYINTSETILFHKNELFYGYDMALPVIAKEKKAIVVEGNTDVMACYQVDIRNVLAALGTAFTDNHARVLKRLGVVVYFCFDADAAGQKATFRAVEMCVKNEVSCKVMDTSFMDDDLCKHLLGVPRGMKDIAAINQVENSLENAVDGFKWLIANRVASASDDIEKGRLAKELVELLAQGQEELIKTTRLKAVAKEFDFPEKLLREIMVKQKDRASDYNTESHRSTRAGSTAGGAAEGTECRNPSVAGVCGGATSPAPPENRGAENNDITDRLQMSAEQAFRAIGYYDYNDLGNARRLHDKFGDVLKYCFEMVAGRSSGQFLVWTGYCWSSEAVEIYKQMVNSLVDDLKYEYSQAVKNDYEAKALRPIARHIDATANARGESGIETKYSGIPGVRVNIADLDTNQFILPVRNGVVNLRTGELEQHNPEYYYTNYLPFEYDPVAQCDHWLKFLDDITDRNEELIDYLQRCVGYSLTGDVSEQVLFFLYGEGRNGKSTFIETVQYLLAHYAEKSPIEMVIPQKATQISCDLANLRGKRFTVTSEMPEGQRLDEAKVKDYTGGDILTAQFKFGNPFKFKPTCKIWLYGNHKPTIKGQDVGIWRRIRLIPLLHEIPKEKVDRDLPRKLQAEINGILAWAVRGCVKWREDGLTPPEIVIDATETYRSEQDYTGQFVSECLEVSGALMDCVQSSNMYDLYKAWCQDQGIKHNLNQPNFNKSLTKHIASNVSANRHYKVCKYHKESTARYWMGFKIKPDWRTELESVRF